VSHCTIWNEGTGTVKANRRRSTPVDIDSIIIITPGTIAVNASADLMIPAVTYISVDYPQVNSTHLTMGMRFINSLSGLGDNRKLSFIKVSTIFRLLRILGLMAVLSYMIVILFTWIYANHQGYVYFSAGEPVSLIKYPEWVLGILGIIVTASVLRRELDV
jgi:hypothetical protein